jgi:hypothetical protein
MIRIDEVYNTLFWPYIEQKLPATRMFYCFPHGRTDPGSLLNHRDSPYDKHYTFFHDQEPIHLDVHRSLFESVISRNADVRHSQGAVVKALIHSEKNSEAVDQVCSLYGWQPYYYFFHGWAALDWFRGYNQTWLMPNLEDREISATFICPNRIVAGMRGHRLILFYYFLKLKMMNNHISFPEVCPAEKISVKHAIRSLTSTYPDIETVYNHRGLTLPLNFKNEENSPMHSCWLSLFDECATSLLYVVTETLADGNRLHLTEKTFKPICLKMPFVLVSTPGSLEYLRSYGFKTFAHLWDESYDEEPDYHKRLEKIAHLLKTLNNLGVQEKQELFNAAKDTVIHNFEHFYSGGFENILTKELHHMLDSLSANINR